MHCTLMIAVHKLACVSVGKLVEAIVQNVCDAILCLYVFNACEKPTMVFTQSGHLKGFVSKLAN